MNTTESGCVALYDHITSRILNEVYTFIYDDVPQGSDPPLWKSGLGWKNPAVNE